MTTEEMIRDIELQVVEQWATTICAINACSFTFGRIFAELLCLIS